MSGDQSFIERLSQAYTEENNQSLDELMPAVYDQLRKLAANCLASENPGHTLRATALVHEAYVRLAGSNISFEDRVHFYAVAARMLRRILVDHAKTNRRQKRGGGAQRVDLEEAVLVGAKDDSGILALDDALTRLIAVDRRKGEIIQLLFFGGLTYEECAAALKISQATLYRDLTMAKAWLYRELAGPQASGAAS
jgi:RNA polymerase sigma factor (TIGR02999 family)